MAARQSTADFLREIARTVADIRAGRLPPLAPRKTEADFADTLTDAEREAMIADMQATHRPNAKAMAGQGLNLPAEPLVERRAA